MHCTLIEIRETTVGYLKIRFYRYRSSCMVSFIADEITADQVDCRLRESN